MTTTDFFVSNGDRVEMRDRTVFTVTDIADPGTPEGEYQTISRVDWEDGKETVTSSMPAETICVGKTDKGQTVVTDLSEIVRVLN